MKTQALSKPQIAFWGILLLAIGWIAATLVFEIHLGWPGNAIAWAKRLVGWGVEAWLVRTVVIGMKRYHRNSL